MPMARLDPVRAIPDPPRNGEAVRGGSGGGASFHGSDGLNVAALAVRGGFAGRGDGLNAVALALRVPAEAVGDVWFIESFELDSDRNKDGTAGTVGVLAPEGIGDCGRPTGVGPRYDGRRVGVYGRRVDEDTVDVMRGRVGVR